VSQKPSYLDLICRILTSEKTTRQASDSRSYQVKQEFCVETKAAGSLPRKWEVPVGRRQHCALQGICPWSSSSAAQTTNSSLLPTHKQTTRHADRHTGIQWNNNPWAWECPDVKNYTWRKSAIR